jgi:hypothetical protein
MSSYHINPIGGDVGKCSAQEGNCPFGNQDKHYETPEEARKAYETQAEELEDSGQVWPPPGLPKSYHVIAGSADLIRHYNDSEYGGAEGVCLGVSSFISYQMLQNKIPHKLVRGVYLTEAGEEKAHWWIESRGWIFDASRGQFEESRYRSGVIKTRRENYRKHEEFEPGHATLELVEAELKGCFGDAAEASYYLATISDLHEEAKVLADKI